MRVVVDINIIVSALIVAIGYPAVIIDAWLDGKFKLLTCAEHLDELREMLKKPNLAELIKPHKAGRLVNQLKKLAESIDELPKVENVPAILMTIICSPWPKQAGPTTSSRATKAAL